MPSNGSELLYESIVLPRRHYLGWQGRLRLVLCFRKLLLLGQVRLQASLVCHGELTRIDQRIVSGGERIEFLDGHRGEGVRAGGASNVAVQFPGRLHRPESVPQVGERDAVATQDQRAQPLHQLSEEKDCQLLGMST